MPICSRNPRIVFLIILFSLICFTIELSGQTYSNDSALIDQITNPITQNLKLFSDTLTSDTDIQLSGLQLIIPNGGESWRFGSLPKIEWNVGLGISNVKLEYTTNGGSSWISIINSTPNNGSYLWETMPNISTSSAKIRITDINTTESDESNNFFSINSISPNIDATISPIKILPLGNSITFDQSSIDFPNPRQIGDKKSYRYYLYNLLTSANYNFDFIGGEPSGSNYFDDFQSASWPGINANRINRILHDGYNLKTESHETINSQPYLQSFPADIILLHIGTNEPKSITDVENILNKIDQFSTNTWVIIALIINENPPNPAVRTYNESLRILINSRINYTTPDKLLLVNMENLLIASDFTDTYHPNDNGYEKMANVWFTKLQSLLGLAVNHSPKIKSAPNLFAAVTMPYSYNVSSTGKPTPKFSLLESPTGMVIDSITGVIDWNPNTAGSYNVKVSATNSEGSDLQAFILDVKKFTTGMIHYWKLEEEFGFPYKDHFGTNDGIELRYPPSTVMGKVGKGLDFSRDEIIDGIIPTGNRITIRDDDTYDWSSNSSFSIECWIKRDQNPNSTEEEVIIGRGLLSSNFNWRVSVTSDKRVKFVLMSNIGTGITLTTSANLINNGIWYHVVAVRNYSDRTNKIYLNGFERASSTWDYSSGFASNLPITVGSMRNSTSTDQTTVNRYDGIIDEIALYNKALSISEILHHYSNGIIGIGYEEYLILADISVLLQGSYISSTSPYMSTVLNYGGYLPLKQPFNDPPWNYNGHEEVSDNFFANNPTIVDWILVELRHKSNPTAVVSTRAAFLKSDGKIVDIDGMNKLGFYVPPDDYYVVVKHRNHLPLMNSGAALTFLSNPAFTNYNFTDHIDKAYTTGPAPMIDLGGGKFGMWAGDINQDKQLSTSDYEQWYNSAFIGESGYEKTDFNMDSQVNLSDYALWLSNALVGAQSTVP